MNKLAKILLMLCLFTSVTSIALAQSKEMVCEGQYTYYSQRTDSQKDCERIALDGARIDALRTEFGSVIQQNDILEQSILDNKESMSFSSISSVDVKGEWLKDIDTPQYSYNQDKDGSWIVTCKVKILARPLNNNATSFDAYALRAIPDKNKIDREFRSGDKVYLYFSAPVDGYLQAYLLDSNGDVACLFPYPSSSMENTKVKGGKEYILFDRATEANEFGKTKEYILETDEDYEYNRLIVVFSPNQFPKAIVKNKAIGIPLSTTDNEFTRWRLSRQRQDTHLGVKEIILKISKIKIDG